jgi:hypothetical protein
MGMTCNNDTTSLPNACEKVARWIRLYYTPGEAPAMTINNFNFAQRNEIHWTIDCNHL